MLIECDDKKQLHVPQANLLLLSVINDNTMDHCQWYYNLADFRSKIKFFINQHLLTIEILQFQDH